MLREVKVKTKMVVPLIKLYKNLGGKISVIEHSFFTLHTRVRLYRGAISLWLVSTANAREYDKIRVACWGADND